MTHPIRCIFSVHVMVRILAVLLVLSFCAHPIIAFSEKENDKADTSRRNISRSRGRRSLRVVHRAASHNARFHDSTDLSDMPNSTNSYDLDTNGQNLDMDVDGSDIRSAYEVNCDDEDTKANDTSTLIDLTDAEEISIPSLEYTSNPSLEPTGSHSISINKATYTRAVCTVGQKLIHIDIMTDNFPRETSWTLTNLCTNTQVLVGGPYLAANTLYTSEECISEGNYEFEITDAFGDGICCANGNGEYRVQYDGIMKATGGSFGLKDIKNFGDSCLNNVPSYAPSISPSTKSPINCPVGQMNFQVDVITDNYPRETSWTLTNLCTNTQILVGGPYLAANTLYSHQKCIPVEFRYEFKIIDTYGDGICCSNGEGSYRVKYGETEEKLGGDFIFEDVTLFGNSCSISSPSSAPSTSPTYDQASICPVGETFVQVNITLDNFPEETYWTLFDKCKNVTVLVGGPYYIMNSHQIRGECIPDGRYEFKIFDTYGDGICCGNGEGKYNITYGDAFKKQLDGIFGLSEVTSFGDNCLTPVVCPAGEKLIQIHILADYYSFGSFWTLTNLCSNTQVLHGEFFWDYYSLQSSEECVPEGMYEFKIFDGYGDILQYSVVYGDAVVKSSAGDFYMEEISTFGDSCSTPMGCPVGERLIEIKVLTDNFPQETSWTLNSACTGTLVVSEGPYDGPNEKYTHQVCIPEGKYEFMISDQAGDGICCDHGVGSYEVKYGGAVVKTNGGYFGLHEITSFGDSGCPSSINCPDGEKLFELDLHTDNFPQETSWTLQNLCTSDTQVIVGGPYYKANSHETEQVCIPRGEYRFVLSDDFGDGICCTYGQGTYQLKYDGVVVKWTGANNFGINEITYFGESCPYWR